MRWIRCLERVHPPRDYPPHDCAEKGARRPWGRRPTAVHTPGLASTLRFGWVDGTQRPGETAALQALYWLRRGLIVGRDCRSDGCTLRDGVGRIDRELPLSGERAPSRG